MESNGLVGKILVSESTKIMLERNRQTEFSFEFYKNVEITSLQKEIKTFLVKKIGTYNEPIKFNQSPLM